MTFRSEETGTSQATEAINKNPRTRAKFNEFCRDAVPGSSDQGPNLDRGFGI